MRLLPNSTLPSTEYTVCVALTLEGVPSHDSRSSVETEGKNYLAVPSSSAQSSVSCDDKRHKEPASASRDVSNGYFKCIIFIKGGTQLAGDRRGTAARRVRVRDVSWEYRADRRLRAQHLMASTPSSYFSALTMSGTEPVTPHEAIPAPTHRGTRRTTHSECGKIYARARTHRRLCPKVPLLRVLTRCSTSGASVACVYCQFTGAWSQQRLDSRPPSWWRQMRQVHQE